MEYHDALLLEAKLDEIIETEDLASSKGSGEFSSNPRIERAKAVRKLWVTVYDRWKALLAKDTPSRSTSLLMRFHHGGYKHSVFLSVI